MAESGTNPKEVGTTAMNDILPLSFGVEIECVWMSKTSQSSNDIDNRAEGNANSSTGSDHEISANSGYESKLQILCQGVEYLGEIREALLAKNLHVNVQPNPKAEIDYSVWNITYDGSLKVHELDHESLPTRFAEEGQWTACSAELVSPPLPTPDVKRPQTSILSHESLAIVSRYVKTLKGEVLNSSGSFVNSDCGLHVHMGIDPSHSNALSAASIPLPILQQLAWLLVRFEPIINGLHSSLRRGHPNTPSGKFCRSNQTSFLEDGHTCRGDCLVPLAEARQRIFASNMTTNRLAWLMGAETPLDANLQPKKLHKSICDTVETRQWNDDGIEIELEDTFAPSKYKMVNWSLLCREKGPRTIEFRQSDGTLDAESIGHTVFFYTALLRAAERLAQAASPPTSHQSLYGEEEPVGLSDLLNVLEINDCQTRSYWAARQEMYTTSEFEPDLKCWQSCHACADRIEQRRKAKARRTQLSKGWQRPKGDGRLTRKQKTKAKTEQRLRRRRAEVRALKIDVRGAAGAEEPRPAGFW